MAGAEIRRDGRASERPEQAARIPPDCAGPVGRVPFWIPITVAAALLQCWRTALQQKLRHLLSVNGAGFVRFLYGAAPALLLLPGALAATGAPAPPPNLPFVLACIAGGLTQILATNLLIMAF